MDRKERLSSAMAFGGSFDLAAKTAKDEAFVAEQNIDDSSAWPYFGSITHISAVASGPQVIVYANILWSGRDKNLSAQVFLRE